MSQDLLRERRNRSERARNLVAAYRKRYPMVSELGAMAGVIRGLMDDRDRWKREYFKLAYTPTTTTTDYIRQACNQPVPLTPEQREVQRELRRITRSISWGWLAGSPTGRRVTVQPDPETLKKAIRHLENVADAEDIVVGKGVISGEWRIGRLVQRETRWRGESLIEESDGVRCFVSTKTLKVVKKRA